MKESDRPYLSVVTASRNDDHGGDPLQRTQIFVDNLLTQADLYGLSLELVLVDWNPVEGRPGLKDALDWSRAGAQTQIKVIQVPKAIHSRMMCSEGLQFFQMVAKNVGLRRATGQFLMATNIDILFSEELIAWIAGKNLEKGRSYRVDRLDIQNAVPPKGTYKEQLEFAWNHVIRSHRRDGTICFDRAVPYAEVHTDQVRDFMRKDPRWENVYHLDQNAPLPLGSIHTNACGDLHLMSREDWWNLKGYGEWELYSLHMDSLFSYSAQYAGITETFLHYPFNIFHIEHEVGSGWSPEGEEELFKRLAKRNIGSFPWELARRLGEGMRIGRVSPAINDDSWGLGDFDLDSPDVVVPADKKRVTALKPEFYEDVLFAEHKQYLHEQRKMKLHVELSRDCVKLLRWYSKKLTPVDVSRQWMETNIKPIFDEAAYLSANPDVAAACKQGHFRSGWEHYLYFGRKEGRLLDPAHFDEEGYLYLQPDVDDALARGEITSGWSHFISSGFAEGRTYPLKHFDEEFYLSHYPEVAKMVSEGYVTSGYNHYLFIGQKSGYCYRSRPLT